MSLTDLLTKTAKREADKPCVISRGQQYSYSTIDLYARRIAASLIRRGVRPGDRVVLLASNRAEWIAAFFGIVGSGAVLVPINTALTTSEISFIIADSEAAVIIVDEALLDRVAGASLESVLLLKEFGDSYSESPLADWIVRADSDASTIFYTSGTTGRPKGAVLSHAANLATVVRVRDVFAFKENDRIFIAGSLSFIYNSVINACSAISVGATIILHERFHPGEALDAIAKERVTVLMSVPTAYVMMTEWASQHTIDTSSVRIAVASGSSLAPTVITRARERLGIELFEAWGMTEGTPITGYDAREFKHGVPESAGKALPGCSVRIVGDDGLDVAPNDVGELVFRSQSNMTGYFRREKETAETIRDGWIYSGDLARRDVNDFIFIVGRKKDMIIRGGANIYPAELEDVILGLSEVAECAVVGIPDERYGETVKAVIVLSPDHKLTEDKIIAFCEAKLAKYKVPSVVEFREALPKGPTGKILKRLLVESPAQVRAEGYQASC
ncbi:class I adenylate-forming enzyme family protein [Bradyrhizobium sp. SYSU BS000235]|uniref:class I adenylate-forming enzyme family protein n=1 Tax=Bradyrhizobium sp. SYSU BS000235 TaxID=3411332 RepID=UPI003C75E50D